MQNCILFDSLTGSYESRQSKARVFHSSRDLDKFTHYPKAIRLRYQLCQLNDFGKGGDRIARSGRATRTRGRRARERKQALLSSFARADQHHLRRTQPSTPNEVFLFSFVLLKTRSF